MKLSSIEKEYKKQQKQLQRYQEIHKYINGVINKKCSSCNQWLPCVDNEYFYNDKGSLDGVMNECIECRKKRTKKWAEDNPEIYYEKLKERNKNASRKSKDCRKEYSRRKRLDGTHKQWESYSKEKQSEYRNNRQHKNHKINKKEWNACKNYFNNECAYCGLHISEHYIKFKGEIRLGDFHKEHVIHEGENDLSNCVPSCKSCNSEKHVFELSDWYNAKNPKFNAVRETKIFQWLNSDYKLYINKSKKGGINHAC